MSKSAVRRAVSTARAVREVIRQPPYVQPGHFYSPLTGETDRDRALRWQSAPGVDLAEQRQLTLASELSPLLEQEPPGPRYVTANAMFGAADAALYRAMLTYLRPARVLEVGSGYSTAVALDEADANQDLRDLEITCVEPFPDRLNGLLRASDRDRVTVLRQPVQDTDLAVFERLLPSDVLFVDSTHVVKAGSDVVWLFLHVLPRLAPGVVVHVHDVFWPFEYPAHWLRERRDWTEAYFVHAFLAGNTGWEILLFASWLWRHGPGLVPRRLAGQQPGSIWIRKLP
jgi:predicted O-methyltransferase YrrM